MLMQGQRQRETKRQREREREGGEGGAREEEERVGLYNRLPYYFYCPSELPLSQAGCQTSRAVPSYRFMLGCTQRMESGPRRQKEGWLSHRLKQRNCTKRGARTGNVPRQCIITGEARCCVPAILLKCVQNWLWVNLWAWKKRAPCVVMHQAPVCQKQNSLRFIKIQIGGTEAWVTSGGLLTNCMLAGAEQHWQYCWFFGRSELMVLINEEETGMNETRRWANAIKRRIIRKQLQQMNENTEQGVD